MNGTDENVRLRVMTYNLRGLRLGPDKVAAAIEASRPDLVLVQESGPRLRFRRLARSLGMAVAVDPLSPLRRRIKNALLVRPPHEIAAVRFQRFSPGEFFYPRGVLVARVLGPSSSIWAASVHLGGRAWQRRRHSAELLSVCGDLRPLVLGGDLNEPPGGTAVPHVEQHLVDAWSVAGTGDAETISALNPRHRIDYVFLSKDVEVVNAFVPRDERTTAASDHLPVVVDVRVPSSGRVGTA